MSESPTLSSTLKSKLSVLLLGRVVHTVLALTVIRLSTTILPTEEVGKTYLIVSISAFFSLVLINPIGMYVNRHIHHWRSQNKIESAFSLLNLYFLSVALISIPAIIAVSHFLGIGRSIDSTSLFILVCLNIYIGTWFQTLVPSLNMLGFSAPFVVFTILSSFFGLVIAPIFVRYFSPTALIWMLGLLTGQLIATLLSLFYFRMHVFKKERESRIEKVPAYEGLYSSSILLRILTFSSPIALTTFFMWGQNQSYRILVEAKLGADYLGILGIGLGLSGSIATVAETLVHQLFLPSYYAVISTASPDIRVRAWNKLFQQAMSFYIPTIFVILSCAPFILHILVDSKYSSIFYLVIFGGFIDFFRLSTSILYIVSQSEMNTRPTILAYVLGAVVVVVGMLVALNNGFVHSFTIPFILVAGNLISSIVMYFQMRKLLSISLFSRPILIAIGGSIPFLLLIPLWPTFATPNLNWEIPIMAMVGAYFLALQYRLNFKGTE